MNVVYGETFNGHMLATQTLALICKVDAWAHEKTRNLMVLGNLPVPGRPTIWMIVGQGPIALTKGAGGFFSYIFTLLYLFSSLSPSLWETA